MVMVMISTGISKSLQSRLIVILEPVELLLKSNVMLVDFLKLVQTGHVPLTRKMTRLMKTDSTLAQPELHA